MKEQKAQVKTSFFKKIFIKICRIFGYEIIDQSNFYIPTQEKNLSENLNIPGKKSITLPLGEVKISRKVNALTIIFRSCTNINMLTQNKKRLFGQNKSEYTFRSLNSIITSLRKAKESFPNIEFEIIVVDHNSKKNDLNQMTKQLNNANINNSVISLNVNEFSNKIEKINAENKKVTDNQISNMSNIHKSLLIAKDKCKDLIYFVEDDYIHQKNVFPEMILTYERIASQTKKELILCPADYPYLYSTIDTSKIFFGNMRHWRTVNETLITFLTSKKMITKYLNELKLMSTIRHHPMEQKLHEIYEKEYCLSPIPSLAMHCSNINSTYGLPPNFDWKKIWEENEIK